MPNAAKGNAHIAARMVKQAARYRTEFSRSDFDRCFKNDDGLSLRYLVLLYQQDADLRNAFERYNVLKHFDEEWVRETFGPREQESLF